jgi:hypothetical protein
MSEPNIDPPNAPAPSLTTRGESFALGIAFEILFWIAIGVLWLAFSGGIVGAVTAIVVGGTVFVLWRAVAKRSRNPIQAGEARSKWER